MRSLGHARIPFVYINLVFGVSDFKSREMNFRQLCLYTSDSLYLFHSISDGFS